MKINVDIFVLFLIGVSSYGNLVFANNSRAENLRVLKSFANSEFVECPLSSSVTDQLVPLNQVLWLNEINDFNKPDAQVMVSASNLLSRSLLQYQLINDITHISCGFIFNNQYVRLKLWQISYVENPMISIKVQQNPTLINYNTINSTFSEISAPPGTDLNRWLNSQVDLLRVRCENNFDRPLNMKYVWMYVFNPITNLYETWHKLDLHETIETVYPIFYNPDTNKNGTISQFLFYVLTEPNYSIRFQCTSYPERFHTYHNVPLIAFSSNLTIIKGAHVSATSLPIHPAHNRTGVIVGAVLGSILGFLLLLCLILLLVCCCLRLRKRRNARKIRNDNVLTQSSSMIYPVVNYNNSNTAEINNNIYPVSERSAQFSNQNQLDVTNLNITEHQFNNNFATDTNTLRSVAPDIYLSMLTVHKDPVEYHIEDNTHHIRQGRNELAHMYVDEERYHHQENLSEVNEFYSNNYQQQQNRMNYHYV